jgi:phosphoserine aminotransferase
MSRVYNFSAGPAALPLEVLETIRNDIPDWQSTGMSVMEVSHRSKDFAGRRYFADVDGADESRRLRRYR